MLEIKKLRKNIMDREKEQKRLEKKLYGNYYNKKSKIIIGTLSDGRKTVIAKTSHKSIFD